MASLMADITPPPRLAQARRGVAGNNDKENASPGRDAQVPPSPPYPRRLAATPTPLSPVQTPTKTAPGPLSARDVFGQKLPMGIEVKNTFLHYNSPIKTVTVVTPPKTVPSNFAPEFLRFDQTRTPHPSPVASTPSTGGRGLQGQLPSTLGLEALGNGQAFPGTLLRLADFLPSPTAQPPSAPQHPQVNMHVHGHCEALPLPPWPVFDQQNLMPQVPPLPLPSFGHGCQMPQGMLNFMAFENSMEYQMQQAQEAAASAAAAAAAATAASLAPPQPPAPPAVAVTFDGQNLQFLSAGEAQMMGGRMPFPPPGPAPATQQRRCDEAVGYQCTQPATSSSDYMQYGMAPARVSISVGHFPEPSPQLCPAMPFQHQCQPMHQSGHLMACEAQELEFEAFRDHSFGRLG